MGRLGWRERGRLGEAVKRLSPSVKGRALLGHQGDSIFPVEGASPEDHNSSHSLEGLSCLQGSEQGEVRARAARRIEEEG